MLFGLKGEFVLCNGNFGRYLPQECPIVAVGHAYRKRALNCLPAAV